MIVADPQQVKMDLDAYDNLPERLRDFLKTSECNLSAKDVDNIYQTFGVEATISYLKRVVKNFIERTGGVR